MKFRHLLEAHELTKRIFDKVNAPLEELKLLMREASTVDATIIGQATILPSQKRPSP